MEENSPTYAVFICGTVLPKLKLRSVIDDVTSLWKAVVSYIVFFVIADAFPALRIPGSVRYVPDVLEATSRKNDHHRAEIGGRVPVY